MTETEELRLVGNCGSCYYFAKHRRIDGGGTCHRYPKNEQMDIDDYCGEYKSLDKRDTATLADPYDIWEVTG